MGNLRARKLVMNYKLAITLIAWAVLLPTAGFCAVQSGHASPPEPTTAAETMGPAGTSDACTLLNAAEIWAVQGEPVQETKSNARPSGGFVMSQCYFRTATAAKSISLTLVTPASANPAALTPREYWRKQFHPPAQAETENDQAAAGQAKATKDAGEEREKESPKPLPVEGLGDEAYWVGNPITGALYVLQGNAFLRISVGGEKDESVRIRKARTLAEEALKRLPTNSEQGK